MAGSANALYTTEARLYDVAFSWDIGEEIDWLVARLGVDCAPILEPACGSGRVLEGFARRGIEAVGFDSSPAMVHLARERLQTQGLAGDAVIADLTAFDLGRRFGGAICPVDTLAHLTEREQVLSHLRCMARHLRPGSRYLIQLELRDPADPWRGVEPSVWENEKDGVCVHTTWSVEEIDLQAGVEVQRSRLECLSGPDAGRVVDELHRMAAWTPERFAGAIADTPFAYRAVYDGDDDDGWPARPVGTAGRLLWHELALER